MTSCALPPPSWRAAVDSLCLPFGVEVVLIHVVCVAAGVAVGAVCALHDWWCVVVQWQQADMAAAVGGSTAERVKEQRQCVYVRACVCACLCVCVRCTEGTTNPWTHRLQHCPPPPLPRPTHTPFCQRGRAGARMRVCAGPGAAPFRLGAQTGTATCHVHRRIHSTGMQAAVTCVSQAANMTATPSSRASRQLRAATSLHPPCPSRILTSCVHTWLCMAQSVKCWWGVDVGATHSASTQQRADSLNIVCRVGGVCT